VEGQIYIKNLVFKRKNTPLCSGDTLIIHKMLCCLLLAGHACIPLARCRPCFKQARAAAPRIQNCLLAKPGAVSGAALRLSVIRRQRQLMSQKLVTPRRCAASVFTTCLLRYRRRGFPRSFLQKPLRRAFDQKLVRRCLARRWPRRRWSDLRCPRHRVRSASRPHVPACLY